MPLLVPRLHCLVPQAFDPIVDLPMRLEILALPTSPQLDASETMALVVVSQRSRLIAEKCSGLGTSGSKGMQTDAGGGINQIL